jgi:hypothetical protein
MFKLYFSGNLKYDFYNINHYEYVSVYITPGYSTAANFVPVLSDAIEVNPLF